MLFCIAALLQALAPVAHSRDLYRYYDGEGKMVVDYRVPTEYAGAGYEVLNEDGVVIKVVPRELTEEEKQERNAQEIQQAAAEAERERLRKWDESLLLRYSTIADIEDARERALRDLRIRVSILKSNKRSLKQQVENYQSQAADLERSGQEVDVDRLRVIEDLQREIATTDRAIAEREREIEEVSAGYQADIDRFALLLEVVELRRSMLAQDRK
jgi:translation initiation factor 2 beta subunit (eIF-2beta)/eIF-5